MIYWIKRCCANCGQVFWVDDRKDSIEPLICVPCENGQ